MSRISLVPALAVSDADLSWILTRLTRWAWGILFICLSADGLIQNGPRVFLSMFLNVAKEMSHMDIEVVGSKGRLRSE